MLSVVHGQRDQGGVVVVGVSGCGCRPALRVCVLIRVDVRRHSDERPFSIRLVDLPTQRYRRQRNKDTVDFVVAIGGIMGLFLGASILSLVEFIYFFTVRLMGTAWMQRSHRLRRQKTQQK